MAMIDRKTWLFESIVRLRRAAREAPDSADIAAVRMGLEEELGETVSRRLAARLLGMSHTALTRWIKTGDIPVVFTPASREEVPVAALLDLYEAVNRERESGRGTRRPLGPTMIDARNRARRIRGHDLVPDALSGSGGHRTAERRSLAYHRVVARQLRRPAVDDALHLVRKWREQRKIDERYASRWEEVLRRPVSEVARIISEDSASAGDLRQSSPFAGMLSEAERRRVLEEIR